MKEKTPRNPIWVEMGSKLWNFQQELGLGQIELGQKFSTVRDDKWSRNYTRRTIQGYESGENELSSELLYNIWKAGFSVDLIFAKVAQELDRTTAITLLNHVANDGQRVGSAAEKDVQQKTPKGKKPPHRAVSKGRARRG